MSVRIEHKGRLVPAEEITIPSPGDSYRKKLIPERGMTQYDKYGIPTPCGLDITDDTVLATDTTLALNKLPMSEGGMPILVKYVREGSDGFVLQKRSIDEDVAEYYVANGKPIGAVVAFSLYGKLRIGWSKRHTGDYENDLGLSIYSRPMEEPLPFIKKDAVRVAIQRGIADTITYEGSSGFTENGTVISRSIMEAVAPMVERAEAYYKLTVTNIVVQG